MNLKLWFGNKTFQAFCLLCVFKFVLTHWSYVFLALTHRYGPRQYWRRVPMAAFTLVPANENRQCEIIHLRKIMNCLCTYPGDILGLYFPRCCTTLEINTKITLSWAHKHFVIYIHYSLYMILWNSITNYLIWFSVDESSAIQSIRWRCWALIFHFELNNLTLLSNRA